MQPSEYEIQREVEALRDLRRRSTAGGPGSLILDPDLPSESQTSQTATYWPPTDESSSSSHEEGSDNGSADGKDDPFHLFWVPARLHPEIAPAEFREFLKEHARSPVEDTGGLGRSASSVSSGLGRKRSMLSRQYKPSANDGIEEEKVVPVRRNRSSIYANSGPQLTISDLQKLEELAEEASMSDDPSRLRSVLRRSLSLNVSPSVIDQMDDMPDLGDDADSPIVIPRPNQALRRSARTKIRKPGMVGEGSHRFTATRSRRKSITRSATMDPRSSSDMSISDHGHVESSQRSRSEEDVPEVPSLSRPESFSEEALIYDAYVTEEPDDSEETPLRTTTPELSVESSISPPSTTSHSDVHEPVPVPPSIPPVSPVLHHPQPQRAAAPAVPQPPPSPRSPSPPAPASTHPAASDPQPRPSLQQTPGYHPPSPSPSESRRDKDKKGGLFGKWGSDKGGKKQQKEKESREREKEREKDTGFFGSLFGGRKKQDETPPALGIGTSGRETAAALLGASKSSKSYVPSPSPQLAGMYARYPIHVERAIYRLSHIKLANPRRPLYEQVLISNLMFWYLGVINKTQTTNSPPANGAALPQTQAQSASTPDKEQQEREQKEKEEREKAEKERLEKEQEPKERQRRGSLTKQGTSDSPGARRAEMPVRGPQYEMQHRVMEQEYGNYGAPGGASLGRSSSSPSGSSPVPYQQTPATRSPSAPPAPYTVHLVQPQPQTSNGSLYNMGNISMQPQQYAPLVVGGQLPPGAMPPVAVEQTWLASAGSQPLSSRGHSSPSPPPRSSSPPATSPSASATSRRTRSPPNRYTPAQEKQPYSGGRLPSRSLSASAAPPIPTMHHVNGKLKKGSSAHAVVQNHRRSEDEDMPLALWQQQQRRK